MFHRSRFTQIISLMFVRQARKSKRIQRLVSECTSRAHMDCSGSSTLRHFLNGSVPQNTNLDRVNIRTETASHSAMATVYSFPNVS